MKWMIYPRNLCATGFSHLRISVSVDQWCFLSRLMCSFVRSLVFLWVCFISLVDLLKISSFFRTFCECREPRTNWDIYYIYRNRYYYIWHYIHTYLCTYCVYLCIKFYSLGFSNGNTRQYNVWNKKKQQGIETKKKYRKRKEKRTLPNNLKWFIECEYSCFCDLVVVVVVVAVARILCICVYAAAAVRYYSVRLLQRRHQQRK